jgi:hypothetical protein
MAVQFIDDLVIAIGRIVHHVAPVTPYGAEIEQHQLVFGGSLLEDIVRPVVPANVVGCSCADAASKQQGRRKT